MLDTITNLLLTLLLDFLYLLFLLFSIFIIVFQIKKINKILRNIDTQQNGDSFMVQLRFLIKF